MSKEMVVRYTCNFCGAERYSPADRPPADFDSFQIAAAEGTKVDSLPKPHGFDACGDCIESEPLSTILKVAYPLGKTAKAKAEKAVVAADADPTRLHCKHCPRTFERPQARAAHERWHGTPAETQRFRDAMAAGKAKKATAAKK